MLVHQAFPNASTFGLTENARGEVRLTPLGRRVADSSQEAAAKIDAFWRWLSMHAFLTIIMELSLNLGDGRGQAAAA
jgi:hypothetical protein